MSTTAPQPPLDDGTIRCICGFRDDDGLTIQCDRCLVWQHMACVGIGSVDDAPEQYFCERCLPRAMDTRHARELQMRRRRRKAARRKLDFDVREDYVPVSESRLVGGGGGDVVKAPSTLAIDHRQFSQSFLLDGSVDAETFVDSHFHILPVDGRKKAMFYGLFTKQRVEMAASNDDAPPPPSNDSRYILELCGELSQRQPPSNDDPAPLTLDRFVYWPSDEYKLDCRRYGNLARFIRYSCRPNCELAVVHVHGGNDGSSSIPRVMVKLFSDRTMLEQDEELTVPFPKPLGQCNVECACGDPRTCAMLNPGGDGAGAADAQQAPAAADTLTDGQRTPPAIPILPSAGGSSAPAVIRRPSVPLLPHTPSPAPSERSLTAPDTPAQQALNSLMNNELFKRPLNSLSREERKMRDELLRFAKMEQQMMQRQMKERKKSSSGGASPVTTRQPSLPPPSNSKESSASPAPAAVRMGGGGGAGGLSASGSSLSLNTGQEAVAQSAPVSGASTPTFAPINMANTGSATPSMSATGDGADSMSMVEDGNISSGSSSDSSDSSTDWSDYENDHQRRLHHQSTRRRVLYNPILQPPTSPFSWKKQMVKLAYLSKKLTRSSSKSKLSEVMTVTADRKDDVAGPSILLGGGGAKQKDLREASPSPAAEKQSTVNTASTKPSPLKIDRSPVVVVQQPSPVVASAVSRAATAPSSPLKAQEKEVAATELASLKFPASAASKKPSSPMLDKAPTAAADDALASASRKRPAPVDVAETTATTINDDATTAPAAATDAAPSAATTPVEPVKISFRDYKKKRKLMEVEEQQQQPPPAQTPTVDAPTTDTTTKSAPKPE